MIINNNISAVIANKHLLRNETKLAASSEKLSSGYKINHAYQNPSGMAISNKMRSQILALDRAIDNTSDGISVIQTADGALNEVTSMLQRMRELAVQAANDTNTPEDRAEIQKEVAQLRDEVDRVSSSTEFNKMQIFNGDMQTKVYADNVTRLSVSDAVDPGTYTLTVTPPTKTGTSGSMNSSATVPNGSFTINGQTVTLNDKMTSDDAFNALRQAARAGDVTAKKDGSIISLSSGITTDGYEEVLGNAWGAVPIIIDTQGDEASSKAALNYFNFTQGQLGTDAKVVLNDVNNTAGDAKKFSSSATAAIDGKKVTITDNNGFEMSFLLDGVEETTGSSSTTGSTPTTPKPVNLTIKVTDIGKMTFHVGANKDQTIDIDIPSISAKNLYLDQVNVGSHVSASRTINLIDDAISKISSIRSDLGAAQNRLQSTYDSNNSTSENVNDAISRIKDTDMATEMVEYTKGNVLQQAGTSVLSQANELPQMALQLLQ
ncbi:MAG: flagellin [Lachnospiraceae bacterium]|uniref:Flagellin n=1 Tax=Candidatus Weimeria bifida TaxID=2599074 RepID=A0A6N7J2D1_9FIRM|nr:flagellin [Candidatus Weimeria bifida]RRF97410.1 MAG: flagellin [Lachnospiraceae bacterium]